MAKTWSNIGYRQGREHQSPMAERAIREAADAGNAGAMASLGDLLRKQGNEAEAQQWYRKAADAGQEQ